MTGPYRIVSKRDKSVLGLDENHTKEELGFFVDRLLKLIPSDVLGFYLIGNSIIPRDRYIPIIWMCFCFITVIVSRLFGTKGSDKTSQYPTVIISSVSFVLWVYLIGGPFVDLGFHIPWVGSISVLVWTYFIPMFYKGDVK